MYTSESEFDNLHSIPQYSFRIMFILPQICDDLNLNQIFHDLILAQI